MKKFLMTLSVAVLLSAPTMAELTCPDGEWITAKIALADAKCKGPNCAKKTYCKSKRVMPWAQAQGWCQSQGGNLVSFASACPNTAEKVNNVAGACPNLQDVGNGWIWTTQAPDERFPWAVRLQCGAINDRKHAKLNRYAMCE